MKYTIIGEPLPVVSCTLDAGESMLTEKGSMSWMSPNMEMTTSGGGNLGNLRRWYGNRQRIVFYWYCKLGIDYFITDIVT